MSSYCKKEFYAQRKEIIDNVYQIDFSTIWKDVRWIIWIKITVYYNKKYGIPVLYFILIYIYDYTVKLYLLYIYVIQCKIYIILKKVKQITYLQYNTAAYLIF